MVDHDVLVAFVLQVDGYPLAPRLHVIALSRLRRHDVRETELCRSGDGSVCWTSCLTGRPGYLSVFCSGGFVVPDSAAWSYICARHRVDD